MTSIVFNATIISDDYVLEEDEIFYLTIDSSSLPNDITAGSPFQATVTITDDDCKRFLFVQLCVMICSVKDQYTST